MLSVSEERKEELTIRYLDLLQKYHYKSKQLVNCTRNGIFEFTLARNEDNEDAITPFHVPIHLEIEPLFKVRVVGDQKQPALKLFRTETSTSIASSKQNDSKQEVSNEEDVKKNNSSGVLRQRKAGTAVQESDQTKKKTLDNISSMKHGDHAIQDYEEEQESKEAILKKQNPIYWFGVGVRSRVQQAQTHFQKGLELITDMANIRIELSNLEKELSA